MRLLSRDKIKILYRREFERYNIINVRKDQIKLVLFSLLLEQLNFD